MIYISFSHLVGRSYRYLLPLLFFISFAIHAELPIPDLKARITDLTQTLTTEQESQLTQQLIEFENHNNQAQIAILIIPSLQNENIEAYAVKVFEKWQLGRKNSDTGILLLIAKDDRQLRIEVGYGFEGNITDVQSSRIINQIIIPEFQSGDYYQGIQQGINALITLASSEAINDTAPSFPAASIAEPKDSIINFIILLIIPALVNWRMKKRGIKPYLTSVVISTTLFFIYGYVTTFILQKGIDQALFALLFGGVIYLFFNFPILLQVLLQALLSGAGRGGRGGGGGGGFRGGGGRSGGGGASGRW